MRWLWTLFLPRAWSQEKRGWTAAYVDAIYAMEGALRRANASDSPTIQRGAWQHDRAVGEHFSSRDAAQAAGQWRALRDAAAALRYPARAFAGAGVAIVGGGLRYYGVAEVNARRLRDVGCTLPIELWCLRAEQPTPALRACRLDPLGVVVRVADPVAAALGGGPARRDAFAKRMPATNKRYALKAIALVFCSFEKVLVLDADELADMLDKKRSEKWTLDRRRTYASRLPCKLAIHAESEFGAMTFTHDDRDRDGPIPARPGPGDRHLAPTRDLAAAPRFDGLRQAPTMTAAPRDERLLRAIQYAASALDTDQPLRLTLHASDQSKIIRCNRSSLYRFGVGCLVVFAAALAPFTVESGLGDLTADESRRATTDRTNGVMVGVVALLACDYAGELRMRVGGSRDVVSTRLLLRLIALTVLFANAFARTALLTFAPVVLIWTEFPPLRNVVGAWRSHGATFLGVIAVFVSVLLLFAQLGVLLWADCYDSRMYADDDGADDGGELGVEFCVEFDGAFATLARSALTLFVLSTTENAPFVMWPAVDCGRGRRKSHRSVFGGDVDRRAVVFAAIAYFTAYIVVMVYVVVNFMLGSVYDAWHEGHVARVEDEKVRRFHALDAAFHAISRGRTDEDLDRDGWFAFYSELCPGRSRTAADVAFEVLDPDRRGGQRVSHAQFVLRGYRALRADVVLVAARRERRELKTVATTRAPLARIDSAPLDDDASDAASNAPSLDSDARRDVWRRKWR
ncbi:hypothetical protein AURANDRAFT_69079, partial [Aureococcus anophagefferens]